MSEPSKPLYWFSNLLYSAQYQTLIAGVAGGATSTLGLHPLDVVKIRLQVSETHSGKEREVYTNMRDAFKKIWRAKGISGFYQGVSPNLVGATASWGLYFFFYNTIKTSALSAQTAPLSLSQNLSFAALSGVATLTLTNPIWVVKTRMVLQANKPSTRRGLHGNYKGLSDGLYKLAKTEGLQGLYSGYIPGLFGVSHGAIQFVSYEILKNYYYEQMEYEKSVKLNPLPYILFSATSKLLAVSITYPYQVVRSRLQEADSKFTGTWDVVRRTAAHEGFAGFYKGVVPNLIRVIPACCITFLMYENVVHYLSKGL